MINSLLEENTAKKRRLNGLDTDIDARKRPLRKQVFRLPGRIKTLFFDERAQSSQKIDIIHSNPRIYKIRNFLGKGQLEFFDKIFRQERKMFKKSFTEGNAGAEIISEERTSSYKPFIKQQNKIISTVEKKAADFVGLSVENVEPLQVVMYSEGQRFGEHHDAGTLLDDDSIQLIYPRRLVTFFVYLNDLPSGEGCTEFPRIQLSVQPERGSALVFSNVDEAGTCISNMVHKANTVSSGLTKFGLNIWVVE